MKHVAIICAISLTLLVSTSADAKRKASANTIANMPTLNAPGMKPFPSKMVDPTSSFLLWQVSHKPELMNIEYLKYYLGKPDNQMTQTGEGSHVYYWYDHIRQPKCELYHEEQGSGRVVQARMVFHFPGNQLGLDDVQEVYGPGFKRFYDHAGHPTELYSFAPNTSVALSAPQNTFAVSKATVNYLGPPLAAPAIEEYQGAHDHHVARVQSHAASGNWTQMLAIARERVTEYPNDAEAHNHLAQALMKTGSIHEAIGEYKYALALNKFNEPVRQQSILGLKNLHVLPADYGSEPGAEQAVEAVAQKRDLKFVHKPQRLKAAGLEPKAKNAEKIAQKTARSNAQSSVQSNVRAAVSSSSPAYVNNVASAPVPEPF